MNDIIKHYSSNIQGNLFRLFNHSQSCRGDKLLIYPVDQGFEHGPHASFASNHSAYDPEYHAKFAIDAKMNAFAAPIGMLELCEKYAGQLPLILKLNSSSKLSPTRNGDYDQSYIASVEDAVRLGCIGIGMTIYPGSDNFQAMLENAAGQIALAKTAGLLSIVWAYPRGNNISKDSEQDIEAISYSAHIAALIGADIIKVKIPNIHDKVAGIKNIILATFSGKRIVLFSGGARKDDADVLSDADAIAHGGGGGMIVGRNLFQRHKEDAMKLSAEIDARFRTYSNAQ